MARRKQSKSNMKTKVEEMLKDTPVYEVIEYLDANGYNENDMIDFGVPAEAVEDWLQLF